MFRIATVLAALAVFPAASLAARQPDTPGPSAPVAKLLACDLVSSDRNATFLGRMDTVPGASKMAIRVQLFEKLGRGNTWSKLDVPALRPWHTSQPGVQRFAWKQTVDNLRAGGAYRARVVYRWLSPAGAVIAAGQRATPACKGPLPNIVVGDVTVKPGPTADTRSYSVGIQNTGKVPAGAVDVAMNVDKAMLDTVTIDQLAPGEQSFATFTGPVCRHGIRVTADPGNSIGESFESDNSALFACP
jgi:CARDB protein